MPLIKSKSQKAFDKNVETEMRSGKPQDQSLAISYSIKRKAGKKKMADGGEVLSAKNESRPSPGTRGNDAHSIARNSAKKALTQSKWTDNPTIEQAQRPSRTPLSEPRMVESSVIRTRGIDTQGRLKDDERHMIDSMRPDGYGKQPRNVMDELDAKKMDGDPDMSKQHNNGKAPYKRAVEHEYSEDVAEPSMKNRYARGGPVMQPEDHDIELMEREDEAHMQSRLSPSADEGEAEARSRNEIDADAHNPNPLDMERQHSNGRRPYYQGGKVSIEHEMMDVPTEEAEEEHHASIAAAIMARKERQMRMDSGSPDENAAVNYYEGGQVEGSDESQVDLDLNSMEQPNKYYPRNENEVLKENYNSEINKMSQPDDSNLIDDPREEATSDKHDRVSRIRSMMKSRRR